MMRVSSGLGMVVSPLPVEFIFNGAFDWVRTQLTWLYKAKTRNCDAKRIGFLPAWLTITNEVNL